MCNILNGILSGIPLCSFEMETNIHKDYVSFHNDYCASRYDSVQLWLTAALIDHFGRRLVDEEVFLYKKGH